MTKGSMQHLTLSEIENIQGEKLRHMLKLCERGHKFYKRFWKEKSTNVADVLNVHDLESLPVTQKQELMRTPDDFRLDLPDQPYMNVPCGRFFTRRVVPLTRFPFLIRLMTTMPIFISLRLSLKYQVLTNQISSLIYSH